MVRMPTLARMDLSTDLCLHLLTKKAKQETRMKRTLQMKTKQKYNRFWERMRSKFNPKNLILLRIPCKSATVRVRQVMLKSLSSRKDSSKLYNRLKTLSPRPNSSKRSTWTNCKRSCLISSLCFFPTREIKARKRATSYAALFLSGVLPLFRRIRSSTSFSVGTGKPRIWLKIKLRS